MLILGLETSCDDTGVGIVDARREIRADIVASQLAAHRPYGGVVPEIAARAHLEVIEEVVPSALQQAGIGFSDLSAIAATTGPGLIGGVMVGAMMGKAIAAVRRLPFISVNHLEAHALTARLTHDVAFPYLLLLASGGHCQLLLVKGVGAYRLLGRTIDDAVGECFDKCAKMLGLGYPGGPLIEQAAQKGTPKAFALPRPMLGRKGCDFSFSGLKTAVRTLIAGRELSPAFVADMAASLQAAIADSIADRARHAFALLETEGVGVTAFVAGGGVAANQTLCARLTAIASENNVVFAAPAPRLCTDNGVMVAWAGVERFRLGLVDGFDVPARPRWPLEETGAVS
ncbi:MAG: tRNA (adenosine(37)-N6)-threonylcarbamoyltransferase complex transferase subunit TsaD [Alphaproteobacteria bacterium]|nr:tRNA (adenosine(37)-N6)-threonylcarbamoyltransferase complex transferase subunit TsaD [Alphaproteobacteria bacterium]